MKKIFRQIKIKLFRINLITNTVNKIKLRAYRKKRLISPPSIVKQQKITYLANNSNIDNFVETGTYLGDMVYAVKDLFNNINSIELSTELYNEAVKRFKKCSNVKIWNGDSALILANIIDKNRPTIFWLDAHYSGGITARSKFGDTPIENELNIILNNWNERNIILIDDARHFTGENNYPTIDTLYKKIKSYGLQLTVEDDSIIIKK